MIQFSKSAFILKNQKCVGFFFKPLRLCEMLILGFEVGASEQLHGFKEFQHLGVLQLISLHSKHRNSDFQTQLECNPSLCGWEAYFFLPCPAVSHVGNANFCYISNLAGGIFSPSQPVLGSIHAEHF